MYYINIYIYIYIFIYYIYMCVCMCVCVCKWYEGIRTRNLIQMPQTLKLSGHEFDLNSQSVLYCYSNFTFLLSVWI